MNDEHGDETTCGDGNAEDAQHKSTRAARSEPDAEQQRRGPRVTPTEAS